MVTKAVGEKSGDCVSWKAKEAKEKRVSWYSRLPIGSAVIGLSDLTL